MGCADKRVSTSGRPCFGRLHAVDRVDFNRVGTRCQSETRQGRVVPDERQRKPRTRPWKKRHVVGASPFTVAASSSSPCSALIRSLMSGNMASSRVAVTSFGNVAASGLDKVAFRVDCDTRNVIEPQRLTTPFLATRQSMSPLLQPRRAVGMAKEFILEKRGRFVFCGPPVTVASPLPPVSLALSYWRAWAGFHRDGPTTGDDREKCFCQAGRERKDTEIGR